MEDGGTGPMLGFGAKFNAQDYGLSMEGERFTGLPHGFGSEADMDPLTVCIEYHFGKAAKQQ